MRHLIALVGLVATLLLAGCAKPVDYDYSAFRQSQPKSILVLLPQNSSPEVNASHGVLSQVTLPLAESGYYVFPVAVVEEVFKQNGMTNAHDIQGVSATKLREIFAADAVLYLEVTDYGTSYKVITSESRVTVSGKLVDLKTGQQLWSGSATASSAEGDSGNNGLLGMLLQAAINQISHTLSDKSYDIAGITTARLLSAGRPSGILYGPRSPKYGKEAE
ncbi:hypothetical protein EKN56_03380 [Limnobaculum zhutongyuii]|uniref:Lipoprotein n=1 Tax=Limnobaculum zhutongyuii TaxID=2498113 RepID=A0A411WGY9_9GAMM|nr:DUF799 domain-containing protein [Limnobaculum zhutongyuii]QBH95528.1 hypothetical protein EKN56_03380 [Limnobaculum zhutongyuii]TQS88782.1 hypothetical protein ELQ32_09215 [Limnobaculum zhutongyuii]